MITIACIPATRIAKTLAQGVVTTRVRVHVEQVALVLATQLVTLLVWEHVGILPISTALNRTTKPPI